MTSWGCYCQLRACHKLTTKLRREVVLGCTSLDDPSQYLKVSKANLCFLLLLNNIGQMCVEKIWVLLESESELPFFFFLLFYLIITESNSIP